jgi:hypothetical protein
VRCGSRREHARDLPGAVGYYNLTGCEDGQRSDLGVGQVVLDGLLAVEVDLDQTSLRRADELRTGPGEGDVVARPGGLFLAPLLRVGVARVRVSERGVETLRSEGNSNTSRECT